MPLIASVDYPARRIILGIDSVGPAEIDPIDIYKEYRGRRQLNTDDGQNYDPLISPQGNESIGGGERTPEFTNLATGVKIVPFDAEQIIRITGFLISTADGLQGTALFDRSSIVSAVDIDYFPPATKIVEVSVSSGSGLSSAQATQLSDLHTRLSTSRAAALDLLQDISDRVAKLARRIGIGGTARYTDTSITTGSESYTITENGENDYSVSEDLP